MTKDEIIQQAAHAEASRRWPKRGDDPEKARAFSAFMAGVRFALTQHAEPGARQLEPFVVKHYASDERPSIKGNGFDGLQIGEDRQDAEDFVKWLNERLGVNRGGERG